MTTSPPAPSTAPSPPPLRGPTQRSILLGTGLLVALIAVIAWRVARPAFLEPFFPGCVLQRTTGLFCPGCGGTRAVDSLLDGQLLNALRNNPLTTLTLPLILLLWLRWSYKVLMNRPGSNWSIWLSPRVVLTIAAILTLFMIARNIPHPAFDLLRPLPPSERE